MEYGQVGGIDKPVSRIVFGTDRLRGRWVPWLPNQSAEQQAFSLLDRSFELGCNTFDTARVYGDAERTLGAWIRARRNRDDVVVISKGCHPSLVSGRPRLSPSAVSRDLHASLKALGTDFIDVYLLHYDNPAIPVGPIMERLTRHVDEGKIGTIGASNWTHDRIASADLFADSNGLTPFTTSSVQFSLAEWTTPPWRGAVTVAGESQRSAREWYLRQQISVFAYSSLARGFFSEHYDPENPDRNRASRWCAAHFGSEANIERLTRASAFASKHNLTVAQVALAYVLCHDLRPFAVVGCRTVEKFTQNVGALAVKLDDATLHWLSTGRTG